MTLKKKILFNNLVFFLILIFSFWGIYHLVSRSMKKDVHELLTGKIDMALGILKSTTDASIKNYLRGVAEKNKEIAAHYYQYFKSGKMKEEEAKKRASEAMLSQKIGKTGYIFVMNIQKAPQEIVLDAHPVIQGKDVTSVDFVQKAATVKEGYIEYDWKNPGEERSRSKSMYVSYFQEWNWVIAASSYKEEFFY